MQYWIFGLSWSSQIRNSKLLVTVSQLRPTSESLKAWPLTMDCNMTGLFMQEHIHAVSKCSMDTGDDISSCSFPQEWHVVAAFCRVVKALNGWLKCAEQNRGS